MPSLKLSIASWTAVLLSATCFAATAGAMTISGTPPPTATVGEAYDFKPTVVGGIAGQVQFAYVNIPSWSRAYRYTGAVMGTPTQPGALANIQIAAWDGVHYAALKPFTITVSAATAPAKLVISGTPATSATVGAYYSFTPTVVASAGATLTYGVTNKPSWAQFSAATGRLSGTPVEANVASYAGVVISVSNGSSNTALPAFNIGVVPVTLGTAALSWTKPVQNTDGTTITNLAGYRIRYGTSAGALNQEISIGSAGTTSAEIENLTSGTWYFEVAAINSANVASEFSPMVSASIG